MNCRDHALLGGQPSCGLIRIIGHPKYPDSPGPPSVALLSLVAIRRLAGHRFWPDDLSIADEGFFASELLSSHSRVTDNYLVALAPANSGRHATMDQRLAAGVVHGGKDALELIQRN